MGNIAVRNTNLSTNSKTKERAPIQVALHNDKTVKILCVRFATFRFDYLKAVDGTIYAQFGLKDKCLFATRHGRGGGMAKRMLSRGWRCWTWSSLVMGLTYAPLNITAPRRKYVQV